jgi:hypothetical protein
MNVTAPEGVPAVELTVAVNCRAVFGFTGFAEVASVNAGTALSTICVAVALLAP